MTSSPTIRFYTILHNNKIIHLTFDQRKHLKAASLAKEEFPLRNLQILTKNFSEKKLREFLAGNVKELPPADTHPFIDRGTSFQRRVWQLIGTIPFGETKTYGEIAMSLGRISLARAVGSACNANPLALFIPCHRVTAKHGPGGFAGGGDIKKRLLKLESHYAASA